MGQERVVSQEVTFSWAAVWPAGAVRCPGVGVTIADGGHGNSDEVFPLLRLRRRAGGELLWQPFAAAVVRELRGTRRHPQTQNLRLEAAAGTL